MADLFDGILIWRELPTVAEAHIEVSSLCEELEAEKIKHRIVEILPLACGALALLLVPGSKLSSLPSWQSSGRTRPLVDALYSLSAKKAGAGDSIWIADMARADELLALCDHALAAGVEVLDLQLRRSGAAGGQVFLRGSTELMEQIEASNQKRLRVFGRVVLAGDYLRYWL